MPVAKPPADLVKAIQKEVKGDNDGDTLSDILDRLAESTGVTMEFIVGTPAGTTVKGLRAHEDERVRSKAVKLTAAWKVLVSKTISSNKVAKEIRKTGGTAAADGDFSRTPARSALRAWATRRLAFAPKAAVAALLLLLSPAPLESFSMTGAAAGADAGGLFSPRDAPLKVKLERVRALNTKKVAPPPAGKPVILWMDRDHRVQDNWALLYAQQEALAAGAPLAVCFALRNDWSAVGRRQVGFMLRGLEEVEAELKALSIPMFLLPGEQCAAVAGLAAEHGAGMVVCDFSPLREERAAREAAGAALGDTPLYEVDAANVVPVWLASDKQEVGARTLRPKITKLLPKFLEKFPAVAPHPHAWAGAVKPIEWEAVRAGVKCDEEVAEVEWAPAGHAAGMKHLEGFIKERFGKYGGQRNDPGEEGAISDISPWIRFGQISAARCALEAKRQASRHNESYASFIEELVVRRELSDNFCFYQPRYDSLQGCAQWAQDSLALHAGDDRKKEYGYLYDAAALEAAKTHDKLWNAAQKELVHRGKMHGFMRMYWAKKILEWTKSPEEALRVAIFNNDKYALDGRCPNGFVGCMWSIGGVHDMGWKERPVFGKIRYMNYAGCQRKFKIDRYVMRVDAIVKAAKLFVLKK